MSVNFVVALARERQQSFRARASGAVNTDRPKTIDSIMLLHCFSFSFKEKYERI